MTVWVITDRGNEIQGIFDSRNTAMQSIGFSYHKLEVRVTTKPNRPSHVNDDIVTVEGPDFVHDFRVYEESVHSSTVHL